MFDAFPWSDLRYQHTVAIRTKVAELPSASTANRHLAALRGVLKEAWRLGYMTAEEYQRAVDFKPVRGQKAKAAEKGRHLKQGEFAALLRNCDDDTPAGIRDAALLAVGYIAGLRRTELSDLMLADFNQEDCMLTVTHGKGNKERVVPLAEGACAALQDWLDVRGPWVGPLFTVIRKGDHVTLDALTAQSVYDILAKRAEQASVKKFSPHDLRRTFAGDLLDAGADISTVQKLMGHSNADTTAGYDRRDATAKRAAVNKLHLPYTPKRKS
jgi:site-specific recombinase XerD